MRESAKCSLVKHGYRNERMDTRSRTKTRNSLELRMVKFTPGRCRVRPVGGTHCHAPGRYIYKYRRNTHRIHYRYRAANRQARYLVELDLQAIVLVIINLRRCYSLHDSCIIRSGLFSALRIIVTV